MPNVNYYIQEKKLNKKGLTNIRAVVCIESKQISKSMGMVKPDHWNNYRQRVKPSTVDEAYNNHFEINQELDTFQADMIKYFVNCRREGIAINYQLVKDYFNNLKYTNNHIKDFWDTWDQYIDATKVDKAPSSIRDHKSTKRYFQEFEAATGYKITFNTIRPELNDKFKAYVCDTKQQSWNYMATLTRRLKAFLNWSADRGYYTGTAHNKFSATEKQGTVITLTLDEFNTLYNYEFKVDRLAKARDIFCFGCLTGLRIGDMMRLTRENIEDGMIVTNMKKVELGTPLSIPILPQAKAILEKYAVQYYLLPRLSEQKLNKYIKEAAQLAGLTRPIKKLYYPNGTAQEVITSLDQEIHAHLTRKTYITLAFAAGMDIKTVKKITGISNERTLRHYLTISKEVLKSKSNLLAELLQGNKE